MNTPPLPRIQIGVLTHAETCHYQERWWGLLHFQLRDGTQSAYGIWIPQEPRPDPKGWRSLVELLGEEFSADKVYEGWLYPGEPNTLAEAAFKALRQYIGSSFMLTPHYLEDEDTQSVELLLMSADKIVERSEAAPTIPMIEDAALASVAPHTTINEVYCTDVDGDLSEGEERPAHLRIAFADETITPICLYIPNAAWPDPEGWLMVEMVSKIAAAQVAVSDGAVTDAISTFRAQVLGVQVPINPDGQVTIDELRRTLVQAMQRVDMRPVLYVGREAAILRRYAWTLCQDLLDNKLLLYGSSESNVGVLAEVRTPADGARLVPLDKREKVSELLGRIIDFRKISKQGFTHLQPPWELAQAMALNVPEDIAPIDTVVRIPTLRPDGSILMTPGYDASSRLWYTPSIKNIGTIPEAPTDKDVLEAVQTVLTPFHEFPLVPDAGSFAGVVACLLDQLVRPMVEGPRPLFVFDAPSYKGQHHGKSLLSGCIGAVVTGRQLGPRAWPRESAEVPKTVMGILLAGEPFVLFDNIRGRLDDGDLAAVATSSHWSGRLLGSNQSPQLAQSTTWCLTLNGARFDTDLARRCVVIRLDYRKAPTAKTTNFTITNLIGWCIENRAAIIRACLVMVRAWIAAGKPHGPAVKFPTYESWLHIVGGILHVAGISGLERAVSEASKDNTEAAEHSMFITEWAAVADADPKFAVMTAAQLGDFCISIGLYPNVFERCYGNKSVGRRMQEHVLQHIENHSIDGRMVRREARKRGGLTMYSLVDLTSIQKVPESNTPHLS